jgi:hypothetical protein
LTKLLFCIVCIVIFFECEICFNFRLLLTKLANAKIASAYWISFVIIIGNLNVLIKVFKSWLFIP